MFCPKCGTNFADDGKFCPNCGYKVPEKIANKNQASTGASSQNNNAKNHKNLIITLSIIGGVLLLALISFLVIFLLMNTKVSAKVNLIISDYSDINCTRIPVNVVGNKVDETMYINENGEGLELKSGEYELSFPASPLSENGSFWINPTEKYNMTLKDGQFQDFDDKKIEFKTADLATVTDQQIDIAAEFAKHDQESDKDIDNYVSNTKTARDKAKQEAEAEARAILAKSQIVSGTYLSDDGVYSMTVDVENLRYEIKIGGVTTVDKGYFFDKAKGIEYYHDEAITMEGEYGKQCFIVVTDKEYSGVSMANRYLEFYDGKVSLWRKHDAGGQKAWETRYTFKW